MRQGFPYLKCLLQFVSGLCGFGAALVFVAASHSPAHAGDVTVNAWPREPSDPALRKLIEEDWLRQAVNKSLASATGVTTHSDAVGGADGVKDGNWGFHTDNEASPWWHVDLGALQRLDRVLVYNSCHVPDRALRLKVLLSADGTAWREVHAHDGTLFLGKPDSKPLAVPLNGAEARFVRIQLPGPTWLHLDEVEVYAQGDPSQNIALGKLADQSSTSTWSKAKRTAAPDALDYPVEQALERGRELVEARRQAGVAVDDAAQALEQVAARASQPADPQARRDLYLQARRATRRLVLADPRLGFDKLLFVKRITYQSSHIYTDHFDGSYRFGGSLCVLSPEGPDGRATEIPIGLTGGIFGRYDLSSDGRKLAFAYKAPDKGYRIYEVGVDGSGLRQLTQDGADEAQMIEQFRHGYDDMDPCYLPNGDIMFVSTRSKRTVLCHNAFTTTSLYLMNAGGGNLRCVSNNTVNEFTPCVLNDGRVIYTRWEYIDKGCGDVQSLWSVHPDGSGAAHVYKNNVALPATLIDARSVPGSNLLVAIGAPHMPLAVGPVVLINTRITQLTPAAMTNITPEIGYPSHAGYPGGQYGYYKEPFPLGDDLFLVAYNPGPAHSEPTGYGLYVLDRSGNRELIYKDADFSCFQPMPLRPRPQPPTLAAVAYNEPSAAEPTAMLFMADVYQGLDGVPRGAVKYLRVMEDIPKPWDSSYVSPAHGDTCGLQNPAISMQGHFATKMVHGVVTMPADGSVQLQVPAGKNLYFQALDENYMELQRMRTFVTLQPGEQRSCIGCHESRKHAPGLNVASLAAFQQPVQTLQPQPGDLGPRMIHYPSDVQPVLDRHCLKCHGSQNPAGGLELTGEPTTLFNRSYENIIQRQLVDNIDVDPRSARIPAEPPLSVGSHRSKLIERIRSGACPVQLSQPEFVRLVTWIDANAPYYGIYDGKKNLQWKDQPDFRPDPNQLTAAGQP